MRIVDVVAATIGLIILSPLLAILAFIIKCDSPGPVLYRARRAGKGGREFRLYKFRTMAADAHRRGPGVTGAGDPRITQAGRFLRRTKLDELPQLLNVLRGEISLVGPRPEDPRYVALYTPEQRRLLDVRPGITSMASLTYRNEERLLIADDWEAQYINSILLDKLSIDLAYQARRTITSDLVLLLRTIAGVFR